MIVFRCECGQQLQVKEEHAGRQFKCPKCEKILTAPLEDAIQEVFPSTPMAPASSAPLVPSGRRAEATPPKRKRDWGDDDRPRRREEEDAPPRRRREEDDGPRRRRDEEFEFGGPPRRRDAESSGKALAAMILGLATFLVPVLCAIPAIIFGILGLKEIKRSGGKLGGGGMALTGIITGAAGNISILAYWLLISGISQSRQEAHLQNNLKQLSLAMHNFHDVHRGLPPPGFDQFMFSPKSQANLSWRVALLPYVEEDIIFRQFQPGEPWNGPNNLRLLSPMPSIFNPAGPNPTTTYFQVFVGPKTPFNNNNQRIGFAQIVDGTSNTFMIVEGGNPVTWTKPDDIPHNFGGPLPKLGNINSNGFWVAMCDGSVRFVDRRVSANTLHLLISKDDGMIIPGDFR
ncbi:MAG: DUF1559 domain-containing protein [Gemmataceae bacterium]|nr:DUF1559 domain-containing protein [Gemmataceae bacterium]